MRLPRITRSLLVFAAAGIGTGGAADAQVASIGLSSVRAQRFGNEDLVGFDPQPGDRFATRLAVGDFNGDGADDLATGIPSDDGITGLELPNCGGAVIRYGAPARGLDSGTANQFLRQTPDRDPAEEGDFFGDALAACDFDGDGFADLAVGVPFEDNSQEVGVGAVNIYYGAATGLHGLADAFYTQGTAGIPGDSEEFDLFGKTLACGDFDADGFADLAIGVPGEDLGFAENTGRIHVAPGEDLGFAEQFGMIDVIPGSASGLDPLQAYSFDQDTPGIAGDPESEDAFGCALAAGDFDGDAFVDLAIGVCGEDSSRGAVQVIFGGPTGLSASGSRFFSETGIGGLSEDGDQFGFALATGDFDGDGFDDLAIGIPFEDFGAGGAVADTGQVNVLYGAAAGFDLGHTQFWAQDNLLGAGTSELSDRFGYALAAADFDHDGVADLAAGSPGEFVTGPSDGSVTVWMGSAAGLSAARHRGLAAGFDGFPGDPEQHDREFGQSVTAGDFDADGHGDLAIGMPFEDENGLADVGAETVLYGALFADGFESDSTALWTSAVP